MYPQSEAGPDAAAPPLPTATHSIGQVFHLSRTTHEDPQADESQRADAQENRHAILEAGTRLLAQSGAVSVADVARAAGVSRTTVHRHFSTRQELTAACEVHRGEVADPPEPALIPPGRLGRDRPMPFEAIHAFDVVTTCALPEQLVAEAQKVAGVPLALYVIDIDGSHLHRVAGPSRLPARIHTPFSVGPEIDRDGLAHVREQLSKYPGVEVVPLWVRGRATGAFVTLGPPEVPLAELARQAAVAVTLADRYTDVFARTTRRKRPSAAAEIQQSLLPPRIARLTGAEVSGNVLPSYEVAGDWFDIVENLDGIWVTIADGTGSGTVAAASSAVALGALRASRRSDGGLGDALMMMHQTLVEMPGPRAEMTAAAAHWDPLTHALEIVNCGHVPPVIIRDDGSSETIDVGVERGLGGRSAPQMESRTVSLDTGDRLIMVSDGVVFGGEGKAGLAVTGVVEAALTSESATAPDTVRKLHQAVLAATDGDLEDDATAVCLAVG